tara:strand:+ start:326 stop:721 length:396 start_codon:yes stop_codon:yes gene_type:complete
MENKILSETNHMRKLMGLPLINESLWDVKDLASASAEIKEVLLNPSNNSIDGLMVKLGGGAEAMETFAGAIDSIDYVKPLIKPFIPDDAEGLDVNKLNNVLDYAKSKYNVDETLLSKIKNSVLNLSKELGL